MKISIITACYNSEKTIRDTIESVLGQTCTDYEYIVVDGASKDGTLSIIKEYEQRFGGKMRYISEKDNGIYDAMNKGIRMASGDVIGILNSDDFYLDNNVLMDINKAFDGSVDAICGNLYFVDWEDTDKVVRTWKGSEPKSFKSGWHPAHPTFYAKKELYDRYGLFDTSFDVSADFELMLRFVEKHKAKIKYIDRFIIKMRQGGESTGSISKIVLGNKNIVRAFEKNGIKVCSVIYLVRRLFPKAMNIIKNKFSR